MIKPIIALRNETTLLFIPNEISISHKDSLEAIKLATSEYYNIVILSHYINEEIDRLKSVDNIEEIAYLAYIKKITEGSSKNVKKITFVPFKRIKIKSILPTETNADLNILAEYKNFGIKVSDDMKAWAYHNTLSKFTEETDLDIDPLTIHKWKNFKTELKEKQQILENSVSSWLEPIGEKNIEKELSEFDIYNHPLYLINNILNILSGTNKRMIKEISSQLDYNFMAEQVIDLWSLKNQEKTLEKEIETRLRQMLNQQQKEFLLREKMKQIQKELDDVEETIGINYSDDKKKDVDNKVEKQRFPKSVAKLIANEKSKIKNMMPSSPDANIARNYVDILNELPWRKISKDSLDIKETEKVLDKGHYGLKEVKERVLEYIAVMVNNEKHNEDKKNILQYDKKHDLDLNLFHESEDEYELKTIKNVPILTLVGPPGTGKTSLAKSIADSLNKKFVKISLGGVKDESEIRGHRRTYVGALPGKIIAGIKRAGVSNPVILLDEIDKMASSYKGDPASAMLEVLDPEQNHKFQDHYLEHEYDLSKVLFIATANYYENIPAPLIDRVEIINLSSYTLLEKVEIARKHLISKVIKDVSLNENNFIIDDEVIKYIINHYTLEAGVRNLRRVLDKLARKIVVKILSNELKEEDKFVITEDIAFDLLGVHKFSDELNDKEPQIGSVNGLAYTSYGGSTLKIEVNLYKGKGKTILTGQLKDVMQESAQAAISYVRTNSKEFDIPESFNWDEFDIHIHVPAGAIPKDGPSAGVTFTTALVSALTKRAVNQKIGMTGEITLRGKVLPIGGLKEKSIASHKFGIKTVFIPFDNVKDLVEVPDEVKAEIEYIPVKDYSEIYNIIFKNKISKKS
ncbi:ATP-dependent Lon protease [Mycoplasma testudineum]|uniref:Lon protease n=1 Tax=Mycoplasma testudineum TaxID=244584 RepID=A0A4R6IFZ8_9MOLU|nr:endopeptidase La [Mycoplasma testudineum]OYD27180.1 endopeptidase La [Mycoplasma testudineum]TDO21062.1 ATP-dependent Lon protease [Mycoplasma testudineum]